MCGRYAAARPAEDLAASFGIRPDDVEQTLPADWNVAPTKQVPVVLVREGRRVLTAARWGLVPAWAADPAIGGRLVNARLETAASKPAFKAAWAARRCLLPADGWYEWSAGPGGRRLPWFLADAGGRPLALAGLWETWRDAEGRALLTCTVVTGAAPPDLAAVHDRAPVVLPAGLWERWLDPAGPAPAGLSPTAPGTVVARRVAEHVGDVRANGPQLLDPPPPEAQQTLF